MFIRPEPGEKRSPEDDLKRGVFGLVIAVIAGAVVVAAIVGALILIRYLLLPPGSLN
jgi:hypothetical protein